jgi:hypothetical protein
VEVRKCKCRIPRPDSNPRREDACVVCGAKIPADWSSSRLTEYLDRLAESMPRVWGPNPGTFVDTWNAFRAQCENREHAGRDKFGFQFLGRDNTADAFEEFADGANYAAFDSLRYLRYNQWDSEVDLVLTAMQKSYEAYEALAHLRERRRHGV